MICLSCLGNVIKSGVYTRWCHFLFQEKREIFLIIVGKWRKFRWNSAEKMTSWRLLNSHEIKKFKKRSKKWFKDFVPLFIYFWSKWEKKRRTKLKWNHTFYVIVFDFEGLSVEENIVLGQCFRVCELSNFHAYCCCFMFFCLFLPPRASNILFEGPKV